MGRLTMNIKQLRLFHEVMVTGKISAAAERLNFSQPAASKMLANLESRLGYSLFARGNGRLNATPEAVFLHEETLWYWHTWQPSLLVEQCCRRLAKK